MNMGGKLYISCGVPGSGKTTFLKNTARKDEVVCSRDDIRFALLQDNEEYFSHENKVFRLFILDITRYINSGINVYADATHLTKASRDKLIYSLAQEGCHPSAVECIIFNIPLETCIKRNELRKGTRAYVPRGVIKRMFNQFELPFEFKEYYEVNEHGNIKVVER